MGAQLTESHKRARAARGLLRMQTLSTPDSIYSSGGATSTLHPPHLLQLTEKSKMETFPLVTE